MRPVVRIDQARVCGALLAEVDCVSQAVLRQRIVCEVGVSWRRAGRGRRLGLCVLGLCAGGLVLRRRPGGRAATRRGGRGRAFLARSEPAVPTRGEMLSELWRDVVERESIEAAEVFAVI